MSKERCAHLHDTLESLGFSLWIGLWEAERGAAEVPFDAVDKV